MSEQAKIKEAEVKAAEELNSLNNPDLGRESWLGKKEQSFSTKLLVVVGGIGSFGGLFPIFLEKFTGSSGDHIQAFFIAFSFVYFVCPLLLYVLWIRLTDRVGFPEPKTEEERSSETWLERLIKGKMWISHRYYVLIWIHALFTTIFLFWTSCVSPDHSKWIYLTGFLPFLAPIIAVATMTNKWPKVKPGLLRLSKIKALAGLAFAMTVTAIYLVGIHSEHPQDSKTFDSLIAGDRIINELNRLEDNISNRVDRFAIKASVQKEVTLGINPKGVDRTLLKAYSIDPYLATLGKILLKDENSFIDPIIDKRISRSIAQCHHDHELEKLEKAKKVTCDKCEDCSNCTKELQKPLHFFFIPSKYDTILNASENTNLLQEMKIIDRIINDMMDTKSHRIFPSCLANDDSLNSNELQSAAALINFENSRKLKGWVNDLYLPYCQRKAKSDIDEITAGIEWIHEDMYMRGVAISVATLCLLILCYSELWFLKRSEIAHREIKFRNSNNDQQKESLSNQISALNKNSAHLLFPLSMLITIVGTLSIRVGVDMDAPTIDASSNFRMSSVPTLKLPESAPSSGTNSGFGLREDTVYVVPETSDTDLKESVDALSDELEALRTEVNSLENRMGSKKRGMTEQEWEKWNRQM